MYLDVNRITYLFEVSLVTFLFAVDTLFATGLLSFAVAIPFCCSTIPA